MAISRPGSWFWNAMADLRSEHRPALLIGREQRVVGYNRAYSDRFGPRRDLLGARCWEVAVGCTGDDLVSLRSCPIVRNRETDEPCRGLQARRGRTGATLQEVLCLPVVDAQGVLRGVKQVLFDFDESPLVCGERGLDRLVGASLPFTRMLELARRVAFTNVTVLLIGEDGTGKRQLARALHRAGRLPESPLIAVDCRGLDARLLVRRLREQASWPATGGPAAGEGRQRIIVGTLLVTRVDCASPNLQGTLARLVRQRRLQGVALVGRMIFTADRKPRPLDRGGNLTEDLYYRISGYPIEVPPLRDRLEDLEPLARLLLQQIAPPDGIPIDASALRRLRAHDFPGNIAELRGVLERARTLAAGRPIRADHVVFLSSTPGRGGDP